MGTALVSGTVSVGWKDSKKLEPLQALGGNATCMGVSTQVLLLKSLVQASILMDLCSSSSKQPEIGYLPRKVRPD